MSYTEDRIASKARRAVHRTAAVGALQRAGIPFTSHNSGAHLIVTAPSGEVFDYWPGTGLWKRRDTRIDGRGIRGLVTEIQGYQLQPAATVVTTGEKP